MPTPTAHELLSRMVALLDEYAAYEEDAWPEDLDFEFGHLRLQHNAGRLA